MARHGFGRGEYKYFAYPLPEQIAALRTALYEPLVPVANRWNLSDGRRRPLSRHARRVHRRCHKAGQTRPTPLLLAIRRGRFQRLHQDLYGEHAFPLQVAILLSEPGEDFTGGEFVLTEQRPRMQSRAEVVPLRRATRSSLPCTTVRCREPAAPTASTCVTASARARAAATRSGSSFTTRSDGGWLSYTSR